MRGIQYAAAFRFNHWRLWNTGSPAFAGDDVNMTSRSRGAFVPEVCWITFRPLCQRAQGRPGARCTRGLVCNCAQKTRTRAYRYRRSIPAFPAQWLYGLLRALPGERLFCHRRLREASLLSDLMPAPRHQDHTTSPYAQATHVSRSSRVHRIPPRVLDDREPPLSSGETGGVMWLICPTC
jgi:hypothetical protein